MHEAGVGHQARAGERSSIINALAKFIRPLLQVGVLGLGAFLVIEGQITAGVMIAASILLGRALAPVEASIGHWRSFVASRAAYGRVRELVNSYTTGDEQLPLPDPKGLLRAEAATIVPPGSSQPILIGVNFMVRPGEIAGIIGRSGSGKSSLARALVGLWQPTVGHIRLDGADLSNRDTAFFAKHVGYLPQDIELFQGTVAENIARFAQCEPQEVIQAASLAGAHDMILQLPDDYNTQIGEHGAMLSGGQRQRIAFARALFGEPQLIVLDEPNSNLDSEGDEALLATLRNLKARKKTVVIISHRRHILAVTDQVLRTENGRVHQLALDGGGGDQTANQPTPIRQAAAAQRR